MSLSIAIAGAAGRMGRALVAAAAAQPDIRVVGATARAGSEALGADVGARAGVAMLGARISSDPRTASAGADVWVDFTSPASTVAAFAAMQARAAIVGATGFNAAEDLQVQDAAKRIAIVRSGNFSVGVTVLAELVRQAAARLGPEWDIEITDAHHRRKVDAPSGTALFLGEAVAQARGKPLGALRIPQRDGATGPRPEGGIGFAVIRGGGLVGSHDVTFAAEREVLRFSHEALDRAVFADGALTAARWVVGKPPGLYSMRDVLGFQ